MIKEKSEQMNIDILDRNQFHRISETGSIKGIYEMKVVRYLIEHVSFFVTSGRPYLYKHGYYQEDENGILLKNQIQELIYEECINYRLISSVYRLLIEQPEVQINSEGLNCYPSHWINFQNGMLDVKTMEFISHNPKYYSLNQIPHAFDMELYSNKKIWKEVGKQTEVFLSSSIPDAEEQLMLYQYLGYCMTRDTSFQKFLMVTGKGGTGKSRVIALAETMVGRENTSSVTLQNLNQRFYPAQLYAKLLNACADIPADALESTDTIKRATGEDILLHELKGKNPTFFRSYAKLIFSANKIPMNLDEKSNAWYRRLLVIRMDYTPKEKDRELDQKLKREMPYSLCRAVEALRILYREERFCESARSRTMVEELHRAADTVKAFLDERTEKQPKARIKRDEFYSAYKEYCESYGRHAQNAHGFYKALEEKGFQFNRTSAGRYLLGICLKEEDFMELEEGDMQTLPFQ